MATEVKLPQLGQTMEEGTIVNCLVSVGDEVQKGDILFEIETDKATLEMESPAAGFVKHILAETGQTLPVGNTVLILGSKDEHIEAPFTAKPAAEPTPKPAPREPAPAEPAPIAAATPPPAKAPPSTNIIRLPQLGQTMEEGTIVNCLVKVGDEVKKGDVLFEVETDKATLEMESPAAGFVKHIVAETGQTLPVGEPMMILADKDTEIPSGFVDSLKGGTAGATGQVAEPTTVASITEPPKTKPAPARKTSKVIAAPRAKLAAKNLGIELAAVTGTGPAGRITEKDVRAAAAAAPNVAQAKIKPSTSIPLNKLQRLTAERMLKSKREIPCFYLTVRADVTDLVEFRIRLNKTSGVKVAYNDFIIRACATGLEKFPVMTGQLVDDAIELPETMNIGLAIAVTDGLIAPVVKDAQKKNVKQIAAYTADLIKKARANKLLLTDLEGGCITVSNLGALGIDSFIPIVVPGQCSILGIGRLTDTLVPDNGNVFVRKLMNMTLAVDHRVANGAYAAQFLDFVKKNLEDTSNFFE